MSIGKAIWEGITDPEHKFTPPGNPANALVAGAVTAAAQCKDAAFSDEMEWRLLAGGGSKTHFDKFLLSEEYPPSFRQKGSRLVPYRAITVGRPGGGSIISDLIVGPSPDQARLVHAAQRLLIANGHDPQVVWASKTPYRSE